MSRKSYPAVQLTRIMELIIKAKKNFSCRWMVEILTVIKMKSNSEDLTTMPT
jgi:hypothetical protein